MWAKSLVAILLGAILSSSLVVNLNLLLPFAIDTNLLVSLLLAFPLWVIIMVACYASINGWQALQRCTCVMLLSLCSNTLLLMA